MKLGASTIPYKEEPLTEAVIRRFADAGIESLELSDFHPNFDYTDPALRTLIVNCLRAMDLHLNSIHIHPGSREPWCDLATLDAGHREATLAMHREAVDMAAAVGGCILVTHDIVIPGPDTQEGAQKRDAFLDNLGQLAAYAASEDVRIALENTGSGYTSQPARLADLLDGLGASNVGAVIDTGHRNLCGDPVEALRIVGRRLISLHLHDNHGQQDEHLLPGHGAIDWAGVVGALRDIDNGGVFMYEIGRPEDVTALRDNKEHLLRQLP